MQGLISGLLARTRLEGIHRERAQAGCNRASTGMTAEELAEATRRAALWRPKRRSIAATAAPAGAGTGKDSTMNVQAPRADRAVSMEFAAFLDRRYVEMRILTDTGKAITVVCDGDSILTVQRHIEQLGRACPDISAWALLPPPGLPRAACSACSREGDQP